MSHLKKFKMSCRYWQKGHTCLLWIYPIFVCFSLYCLFEQFIEFSNFLAFIQPDCSLVFLIYLAPNGYTAEPIGCWVPSCTYVLGQIQGMDCSFGNSTKACRGIMSLFLNNALTHLSYIHFKNCCLTIVTPLGMVLD